MKSFESSIHFLFQFFYYTFFRVVGIKYKNIQNTVKKYYSDTKSFSSYLLRTKPKPCKIYQTGKIFEKLKDFSFFREQYKYISEINIYKTNTEINKNIT